MQTGGVPKHIAIIADGNRRWAKQQGLAGIRGHEAAVERTFEPLIKCAIKRGVTHLTFWVFSTENWKRGEAEVSLLMRLFRTGFAEKLKLFVENNIRLRIIGDLTRFPADVQESARDAVAKTANNTALTVVFAMNYGGRDELVRAVRRAAAENFSFANMQEEDISRYLDTAEIPDPELIIRTGGEQRLSGFMLWQCEYAELIFSPVLFPDFSDTELDAAIAEFQLRQRRFGGN